METNLNRPDLIWIIELAENELGSENSSVKALKNCKDGVWDNEVYLRFDGSKDEENNSEDCLVLEHESKGTVVIDLKEDGSVLGIEFVTLTTLD